LVKKVVVKLYIGAVFVLVLLCCVEGGGGGGGQASEVGAWLPLNASPVLCDYGLCHRCGT